MSEFDRGGRAAGAGFYDYEGGKRAGLWPGLVENFGGTNEIPFRDMQERMLFAEALESVKASTKVSCAQRQRPTSVRSSALDSRRGPVECSNTSTDTKVGPGFVARANELAAAYGDRFTPRGHLLIWQPLVVASNKDCRSH